MKHWLISLFILMASQTVWANDPLIPEYSRIYSPDRDPFMDGRSAISLARASGKRVLIQVGGNWCDWCKQLDKTINEQHNLERVLRDGYIVLKVNVSNSNNNSKFTKGLPHLNGYPQLFIAESNGKIIHAQDPSVFAQNGVYQPQRILNFLQRWAPKRKES